MRKITLFINTSQSNMTVVGIVGKGINKKREASIKTSSQTLLPLIDSLIKESGLTLDDISEIKVHSGPGSYTGLRVGVAVANTLGRLLRVPVNGRIQSDITPQY